MTGTAKQINAPRFREAKKVALANNGFCDLI